MIYSVSPMPVCLSSTVCASGDVMCGDPHMVGLRGQRIDWSGVDGSWYCLLKAEELDLHINVRLTAPLPNEFPDRQLITAVSVQSEGNSLVLEVKNPDTTVTNGCPVGISPCLADGGLRITSNGRENAKLVRPTIDAQLDGSIMLSASNLPAECRQFGGDVVWAKIFNEMRKGARRIQAKESFEEWVLRFDNMAAPGWCTKYISEHSLTDVQSTHAIFRIATPSGMTVRLNAGVNHQGDGELSWDGRVLPDLEFWQMDIGFEGLSLGETLWGLLGETARPVVDKLGHEVMEGLGALRGTVAEYEVSNALGTDFAMGDYSR